MSIQITVSKTLYFYQQQANVLTEIALGREATPADVAEVVAWFASPAAAYITGQYIMVDGGMEFL